MKIHILGICGSFMCGIAMLARELGHQVSGSDDNFWLPMSTQLEEQGIRLMQGYNPPNISPAPDLVIIGNVMTRGNPLVEEVLNKRMRYLSGPQWLNEQILKDRHVLAVSGTHGKTTTTAMLIWILNSLDLQPGFLIGGVPLNLGVSAGIGAGDYFIVEADEYDTSFFDKRSKFVHYCPDTLIINNIEYDHADIFDDIEAVRKQFHHLIRTVPGQGTIICRQDDPNIAQVLQMGCWSSTQYFSSDPLASQSQWKIVDPSDDYSCFSIMHGSDMVGELSWPLFGEFNAQNALAAVAASADIGISPQRACQALQTFKNVKRRLERLACIRQINVYDDFAHHPTAIDATLKALRGRFHDQRLIAVVEPRSNTMRYGVHKEKLAESFITADQVYLYAPPNLQWDLSTTVSALGAKAKVMFNIGDIINAVADIADAGDHIVIMSNGSFEGIHKRLIDKLSSKS